MDEAELITALAEFGGTTAERRGVARAARDLADSDQLPDDREGELTVDEVLAELRDAPDGSPADRWNWWMGALDIAYGGYSQFQVRRWAEPDAEEPSRAEGANGEGPED
ncbi:MAG: hypothetical protein ABEJ35_06075 [Halobacteriaceae archaeon]